MHRVPRPRPGTAIRSRPIPRIGWQHAAYVTKTLQEYKSGERASDGANQMMRNVASLLRDDEIRALASYVQGLD